MSLEEKYMISKRHFFNYINDDSDREKISSENFNTLFNFMVKTRSDDFENKITLFIQGAKFDITSEVSFLNDEESFVMNNFEKNIGCFKYRNKYFRIEYQNIWSIEKIKSHNDDAMAIIAIKVGVEEIKINSTFFTSCLISGLIIKFEIGRFKRLIYYSSSIHNYYYCIEKDKIVKINFVEKEGYADYYEDDYNMVVQIEHYRNFFDLISGKIEKIPEKSTFTKLFETYNKNTFFYRIRNIVKNKAFKACVINSLSEDSFIVKIHGMPDKNFTIKCKKDGIYDFTSITLE